MGEPTAIVAAEDEKTRWSDIGAIVCIIMYESCRSSPPCVKG